MRWLVVVLWLAACANAGKDEPHNDAAPTGDGPPGGVRDCAAGQLATNIGAGGVVTCAPIDGPIQNAVVDHCSVYLGWRDNCDGCTAVPTKWGSAGTASCNAGVGVDNTCTTQNLGGDSVQLLGVNVDGDANGDDKFYSSLHCSAAAPSTSTAPCPAGEFMVGMSGTCAPIADAVVSYVRSSCTLYTGWQDSCSGCTTFPAKWGRANDTVCMNGTGTDDTCQTATLGTETINLFGLNSDGNVNDDDKFHIGLNCNSPTGASTMTTPTTCPAGMYIAGTLTEGGYRCESPAPAVAKYLTDHCTLYLGWQDQCDGCLTPPTKWGKVRIGFCANGVGLDDTCSKFLMGGPTIDAFGINPDGDVDGNDTLYVGFRCN